jgi:hypothetical protein
MLPGRRRRLPLFGTFEILIGFVLIRVRVFGAFDRFAS